MPDDKSMKSVKRHFWFILLINLISCVPSLDVDLAPVIEGKPPELQVNGVPDIDINVLTALASGPLIDENLGSCITSDFQLNPQPYRVVGAPYRVVGAPYRVVGAEGKLETDYSAGLAPDYLSDYFQQPFFDRLELNQPSKDVALIVLDEFGQGSFKLATELFEPADISAEMLVRFEQEGKSSHGALVLNHINGILAGLGSYKPAWVSENRLEWTHENGKKIILQAVAPSDFNTEVVGKELGQAIQTLKAEGIEAIVVNMSFVILPCSIVKDFVLNKLVYPSLFDYFDYLISENTRAFMNDQGLPDFLSSEVSSRISDLIVNSLRPVNPEGDPLRQTILANPDTLYVGAAGNFGRSVSAYPAYWDEVLAVSASSPIEKAEFSNTGKVMFTGAWFRLSNPLGLNGHDLPVANLIYAGTSFAAPGVSLFSALDLAAKGACGLKANKPRLSFVTKEDLPLEQAVAEACP